MPKSDRSNANPKTKPSTEAPTSVQLEVGSAAPKFSLTNQHGESVSLTKLKGKRVFVYFYPKADTPGCTTQACNLRDAIAADTLPDDLVVLGVSRDLPEKQGKFDSKHSIGFDLLSDPEHEMIQQYGAWGERSLYGRKFMGIVRSAVLISDKGKVLAHWPKLSPAQTVPSLVKALSS